MNPENSFTVSRFKNRNGVFSWRVDGRLKGVRIRRNFKAYEEAALIVLLAFVLAHFSAGSGWLVPRFHLVNELVDAALLQRMGVSTPPVAVVNFTHLSQMNIRLSPPQRAFPSRC
jgi:hypothetical protein